MAGDGRTVLTTGVVSSAIAAVCCFTPALAVLLGALGLAAWLGWADYVLFPALALFLATTAYGLHLRRRAAAQACCVTDPQAPPKGKGKAHDQL